MATTKITWDTKDPNFGKPEGVPAHLQTFIDSGKTDGTPTITEDGDLRIVVRNWTDTESAQAWLDFFKDAGVTPVSAIIE